MDVAFQWIARYGYVGLFALMMFGIIGLPIPDETLLTYAGYLVYNNTLELHYTLMAACLGSISGISVSYELGRRYGLPLLRKHAHRLLLSEAKLMRGQEWYRRVGKWALVVGYFIPGIRHFTAFVAGMSGLRYRTFGLFAYSGALVWSMTFILLGKLVGAGWRNVSEEMRYYILLGTAILTCLVFLFVLLRKLFKGKIRS